MPVINKWYALNVLASGEAEISIFEEIGGWGVTVAEFKEQFDLIKNNTSIKLLLNSPGGSVMEGMALYNLLSSVRSKLKVEVIGMAASIASIIALAGNELYMSEGTYFMIHNPWMATWGDAEELRKSADVLDKIKGEFVNIYVSRTGMEQAEVINLMNDETWFTADEAAERGFAIKTEQSLIAASVKMPWDLPKAGYLKAPENLQNKKNKPETIRDVERVLRDAGMTATEAKAICASGFKSHRDDAELESIADAIRESIQILKE